MPKNFWLGLFRSSDDLTERGTSQFSVSKKLKNQADKKNHNKQCCWKWGFFPTVGILRGLVGIIIIKWGLKFSKIVGVFWKTWGNFCKMLGFFSIIDGFFEKSGDILANCWDLKKKNCWVFWKKWVNFCNLWGFLGGKFGGDKWGFLIDRVGIFSQDLVATLIINS